MQLHTIKLASSFLAAVLLSLISGVPYLFSTYGPAYAERLNFSSMQINTIAIAGNYGLFFSNPFFGYIADNYSPKLSTLLGSVLFFSNFLCMALTYNGTLPPYFLLCLIYQLLVGMGSAAGLMATLTTQVKNLSHRKGIALSVPLACFALSALVFSQIENFFFRTNVYHFLLFMAFSTGIGDLIASFFLKVVPMPSDSSQNQINEQQSIHIRSQHQEIAITAATKLIIYRERSEQDINNEDKDDTKNITVTSTSYSATTSNYYFSTTTAAPSETTPLIERGYIDSNTAIGGFQFFANSDARVLFFIVLLIGGPGLMYFNNVSTVIKFLNSHPESSLTTEELEQMQKLQNLHVSLLSISSCVGRFLTGFFSDFMLTVFQLRRLWFLILAGTWLSIGHFMAGVIVTNLENLWLASTIIGFGFGSMFGIVPTITSEWFGIRKFGLNWGFLSYAIPIGGHLFCAIFAYNKDIIQEPACFGPDCFNRVFLLSSIACVFSVLLAVGLFWRRLQRGRTIYQVTDTRENELFY
ncbi:5844_t:CDS:2 [Ambispora gerdemannii]|uniref:5844_t:CDS:1 n=1 Tax=Ambispora gerdemannii TaxID=144530 RepID=A0A9N9H634_9GLOM|nr:5844_t:CDS:2 [Ambispora gerdemannii]